MSRAKLARAVLLAALVSIPSGRATLADPPDPRRVLHLLHYVSKDYAEALESREEDELAEQRGFLAEAVRQLANLPEHPARARIAASLRAVLAMVSESVPPDQVGARLEEVASEIMRVYPAPLAAPDSASLEAGRALYTRACASCHGPDGRADTEAAREMKPPPIKFVDAGEMSRLSPAHVHDTIAYGVTGTPMPSFEGVLKPRECWDLAFFVFTLRADQPVGRALPDREFPLAQLAFMTDGQLEDLLRAQGVPAAELAGARQALRAAGVDGRSGTGR